MEVCTLPLHLARAPAPAGAGALPASLTACPGSLLSDLAAAEAACAAELPCAALFGVDAFPSLDEFLCNADFDGARARRRRRARRAGGAPGAPVAPMRKTSADRAGPRRAAALVGMEGCDALLDVWPPACAAASEEVRRCARGAARRGAPG
jgi:hypothetical protein